MLKFKDLVNFMCETRNRLKIYIGCLNESQMTRVIEGHVIFKVTHCIKAHVCFSLRGILLTMT